MNQPATKTSTLRLLVALVCLFVLFLTTASCLFHTAPQQAACNHCSGHAPLHQPVTTCCTSHPQPSSATASTQTEHNATSATLLSNTPLLEPVATAHSLSPQSAPPPLSKPLVALRI